MTIEAALLYLANQCDGARSQDNRGFNGADSQFGTSLARQAQTAKLTQKQLAAAYKMLGKYKKQLADGGIQLPENLQFAIPDKSHPENNGKTPQANKLILKSGQTITIDREKATPVAPYRMVLIGEELRLYSPYDPTNLFQNKANHLNGTWNKKENCYSFNHSQIEAVVESYKNHDWDYDPNITIKIQYLRQERTKAANQKSKDITNLIKTANLDQPLLNGWLLRDYQKEGASWLLSHCNQGAWIGGILADDMGTGKTIQSLVAASAIQRTTGCAVLVVCPVSLADNWRREAGYVGVQIECFSWAKVPEPLLHQKYIIIADEAHALQSTTSARTKKFVELAKSTNCLSRWLLTGTPMKNGQPQNLLPLLEIIKHPIAQSRWQYLRKYCNAHQKAVRSKLVWDFTGSAFLNELSIETTDVILRRTKKEVVKELPEKQRIDVEVELTAEETRIYKTSVQAAINDYKQRAAAGLVDPESEALVTLNILRQAGSRAKIDFVINHAQNILESGRQIVIFTEFIESAQLIHTALGGELLTGATKQDDRQALVDRFQAGESRVFVGTIRAGGVGITLTAASDLILVDRPWTPGDCHQAEDRIHRLGQVNAAIIYWMQFGAIDQAIDQLIHKKTERIDLVLKGKRKTLRGLTNPKDLAKELLLLL